MTGHCSKAQRKECKEHDLYSECPKAIKLEYLSKPITDSEGNLTELGELIADDKAIDLDAWLDRKTFILGLPERLIAIGYKRQEGIPLDHRDEVYYLYQRQKGLKKFQKVLTIVTPAPPIIEAKEALCHTNA
ncbi:hypothetical protein ES703_100304 [subsurface metagenome]